MIQEAEFIKEREGQLALIDGTEVVKWLTEAEAEGEEELRRRWYCSWEREGKREVVDDEIGGSMK